MKDGAWHARIEKQAEAYVDLIHRSPRSRAKKELVLLLTEVAKYREVYNSDREAFNIYVKHGYPSWVDDNSTNEA